MALKAPENAISAVIGEYLDSHIALSRSAIWDLVNGIGWDVDSDGDAAQIMQMIKDRALLEVI